MPGAAVSHERKNFASAAQRNPLVIGRETIRTKRLRRKTEKLPARGTALGGELVVFQIGPERLRLDLFQERLHFRNRPAPTVFGFLCFAHNAPNISVACIQRLPPWPLTIPARALRTWRSGSTALPRSCFTASVTCNMPSICACDNRPPWVWTGI